MKEYEVYVERQVNSFAHVKVIARDANEAMDSARALAQVNADGIACKLYDEEIAAVTWRVVDGDENIGPVETA